MWRPEGGSWVTEEMGSVTKDKRYVSQIMHIRIPTRSDVRIRCNSVSSANGDIMGTFDLILQET